jgi:ribose transport system substrate-binding protein
LSATIAVATVVVGSSSGGAAVRATVPDAVTQQVEKYSKPPRITFQRLASTPAKGKSVIYLANSQIPTDVQNGQYFSAGAKVLGWNPKVIAYAGTPASLGQAMTQAIALKPAAIAESGQEPATFAPELKAAASAGIPVIAGGALTAPTGMKNGGLAARVYPGAWFALEGILSADWIIADSKGHANVALFAQPSFPTVVLQTNSAKATFKKYCPACQVKIVNESDTAIGTTLPSDVVATLHSNPSINYALFDIGDQTLGVDSALASAGITDVKVVTGDAIPQTFDALRSGKEQMGIGLSAQTYAWGVVDAVARYLETKKTQTTSANIFQFFTKSNVPSSGVPLIPPNYQTQYKYIWRVG